MSPTPLSHQGTEIIEIPDESDADELTKMPKSIKELAESGNLTSIPDIYTFYTKPSTIPIVDSESNDSSIPVIDFSILTSTDPDQRSKVIGELDNACQNWGFFMVVNHGVSESLIKSMINEFDEFFNLPADEKQEFEEKDVMDPIRYGTSFNVLAENVHFWRDYLKIVVHPGFHSPTKPPGFSEVAMEFSKKVRDIVAQLLRGISISLGLEEKHLENVLNLDLSLQILVGNYYPPCPQPDLALGMPPHTDHGLLTILTQNEVGGLQINHDGKWVQVNALPNSFLVNTGDNLEVVSNGKYKSVLHRAVVNNRAKRISVVVPNGPALDAVVAPVLSEGHARPKFKPMVYREFLELQQSGKLAGNSSLDVVRI